MRYKKVKLKARLSDTMGKNNIIARKKIAQIYDDCVISEVSKIFSQVRACVSNIYNAAADHAVSAEYES